MRFQRVGRASAFGQQGRQLLPGIGQRGGGFGAVFARSTGQRTADAPHPHLFFCMTQGGNGSFGLCLCILRQSPGGLPP